MAVGVTGRGPGTDNGVLNMHLTFRPVVSSILLLILLFIDIIRIRRNLGEHYGAGARRPDLTYNIATQRIPAAVVSTHGLRSRHVARRDRLMSHSGRAFEQLARGISWPRRCYRTRSVFLSCSRSKMTQIGSQRVCENGGVGG